MNRRRHAAIVSGLAVAMLTGWTGTAAAQAEPERVPRKVAFKITSAHVAPAQEVAAWFNAMPPARVLDTRNGIGVPAGKVGPDQSITIDLSAQVPSTATSIVLNVTGSEPTGSTYVTVYPAGMSRPVASNLNLVPGQTRANAVVVVVPPDRRISLYNHVGSTHLVADLSGYYTTTSTYGYTPMSPVRMLDTRVSGRPLGPAETRTVDLSGLLPATASAVTFNLTGVDATANTYVAAWPTGTPRPLVSNLNLGPSDAVAVPNQATVQLGTNRQISLYNNAGNTHLIVDVAGYYAESQGAAFFAITPDRIHDTRPGGGITPENALILDGSQALPPSSIAVTFNLTGTNGTAGMYVTVWPGYFPEPLASNLNLAPGLTAPNLVTVGLGGDTGKEFWTINSNGYVDLIYDLAGYFAYPQ